MRQSFSAMASSASRSTSVMRTHPRSARNRALSACEIRALSRKSPCVVARFASNAPTSSMNADLHAFGMDAVDGPAHVPEAADFVLDADAVLPAHHLRDEQHVTPLHQFLVE